jgi:molecular chaperone DnaK
MVKDAEAHAEEDRKNREQVETRNRADSLVYETEKFLTESGGQLSGDLKSKLEVGIERVKQALKGSDAGEIRSSAEALQQLWQQAGQELHQAAQAAQGGPAGGGGDSRAGRAEAEPAAGGEEAVEADYEVVDEGK